MPPRPCGRGRATRRRSAGRALSAGCRAMTRLGIDSNIHIIEDNLHYRRTEPPLLAPVFRSEGQARLLAAVLLGGDELSITDLADRAEVAYPTAHREVARLLNAGILSERSVGKTRLITANNESCLLYTSDA